MTTVRILLMIAIDKEAITPSKVIAKTVADDLLLWLLSLIFSYE
jgi:hypothetical protein